MIGERKELEENLINAMQSSQLKTKKKTVNDIKNEFRKYKIINTQEWINDPETHVPKLDTRGLFLLTEQVFLKTGIMNINPENYFTDQEMKKSRQYIGTYDLDDQIDFPLTLENFTRLTHNRYAGTISANLLAKLSASMKLHYNFNIQRESVKRKVRGEVITEAKLVMQNVIEIKDHLKNGTLEPTQIVLNAAIGTADYGENEIIYDSETRRLTITRGTILDIVDGYHRAKGTEMAYHEQGELDFTFTLLILNDTDEGARRYQGQLAQATPIAKERAEELLGSRQADAVMQEFLPKSDLRDRVSDSRHVRKIDNELVAYKLLAETIESQFKHFQLDKMINVYKVAKFLTKTFNYLLGAFEDEFTNKYHEFREKSLINNQNMFIGYIVLARRLMEKNADPSEILEIVENIDFSKQNKLWQEIGVIEVDGKFSKTDKVREAITNYFESIEI
ncbi:hypothetical protein KDN24_06720 [Bacillus sp. Bva_UNVM-123]|uniref:DNA sulfur modification protein DndB n=1 Tax=Bacillus sp. Bva_UNVM-123 TaxID=2829798 RepID=UPI00391F3743